MGAVSFHVLGPQDPAVTIASLTIDDTKSGAAEDTSQASSASPLHLLDLPHETLLAIIARVPFSSEVILNLERVNRQLRDLLTSESNLQDLRNQISTIQYSVAHALRHEAKTDVTWEHLDILQHDTSETMQLMEWMRQFWPSSDVQLETAFLEVGIHLLLTIRRIGISVDSEQEAAEFLLGLKPALVAIMRLVPTRIVACLRNHPAFHSYVRWRDFLTRSSAILIIVTFLLTEGIDAFLTIDAPEVMSDKILLAEIGDQLALAAVRLEVVPNFFIQHSSFTSKSLTEEQKAQYIEILNLMPSLRAGWSVVANDILIFDSWTHEGPSRRILDDEEYQHAFHSFCTDGQEIGNKDMEGMELTDDECDRLFMRMSADLMEVDWYAFVDKRLAAMTRRARDTLISKKGLLETVGESFQSALEIRRTISAKPGRPDLSRVPPHFTFLMLRKAANGSVDD